MHVLHRREIEEIKERRLGRRERRKRRDGVAEEQKKGGGTGRGRWEEEEVRM